MNSSKRSWRIIDAWLDASEDVDDLTSFYKNQIATWQRMLVALQRFDLNRPALIKEPLAAIALQQIRFGISAQTSISQILYSQDQAGAALDSMIHMAAVALSAADEPQPLAVKAPCDSATVIHVDPTQATQTVSPKPAKVIRAADLSSRPYLETEAEVEENLAKLRAELLAAIKAGQRAQVQ